MMGLKSGEILAHSYGFLASLYQNTKPPEETHTLLNKSFEWAKRAQSQAVLEKSLQLAIAFKEAQRIERSHGNLAMLFTIQKKIIQSLPHIVDGIKAVENSGHVPWISLMAYANVLWQKRMASECVPITAALLHYTEQVRHQSEFNEKYFLYPIIYRVKNRIGEEAWLEAYQAQANVTIAQVVEDVKPKLMSVV